MRKEFLANNKYLKPDKYHKYNKIQKNQCKSDTNELIYETETDSQTQRPDLPRGREGEGWTGSLGLADASYHI